jgi:hypothetical protein
VVQKPGLGEAYRAYWSPAITAPAIAPHIPYPTPGMNTSQAMPASGGAIQLSASQPLYQWQFIDQLLGIIVKGTYWLRTPPIVLLETLPGVGGRKSPFGSVALIRQL